MQNARHKSSYAFGLILDKFNYNDVAVLYAGKNIFCHLNLSKYTPIYDICEEEQTIQWPTSGYLQFMDY